MRQEPKATLDGRDGSGQVLRVAFLLATPRSPAKSLANPALAMLGEELASERDLLLREVDEACQIVRNYVRPRKPNARLERSVDDIAASQVVERARLVRSAPRPSTHGRCRGRRRHRRCSRARCGTRRAGQSRRRTRVDAGARPWTTARLWSRTPASRTIIRLLLPQPVRPKTPR